MKEVSALVDYVYFCVYAFLSRTSQRDAAREWAAVFFPLTVTTHGILAYLFYTLYAGTAMMPTPRARPILIAIMAAMMVISFYYFIHRNNARRIVEATLAGRHVNEMRGAQLIGLALCSEVFLCPAIVVGALCVFSK